MQSNTLLVAMTLDKVGPQDYASRGWGSIDGVGNAKPHATSVLFGLAWIGSLIHAYFW